MSVGPFVLRLFLKSSWGADTWPLKLLIIYSLSFLSASNSWNFSERKLTVSARSVSCFSILIWFSFKVFVFSDISFTLDPNFLQQSRQDTSTAWRVQNLFKNLIIAVTSTWCCFFGYNFLGATHQYLQQVPPSYSLLSMVLNVTLKKR